MASSRFRLCSSKYTALNGLYYLGETIYASECVTVKLAWHVLTGSKVAIKIMDKKLLGYDIEMARNEVEAMKDLRHQNICQMYQNIETDEHFFQVLEYCPRGALADLLIANGASMAEDKAREFFNQIVAAVAYTHDRGYAHRDLTLDNILLDEQYNVKLIDFGHVAKPEEGLEQMLYTPNVGTDRYKAPEQVAGVGYRGPAVDAWSLGVSLYCLLCNAYPFGGKDFVQIYTRIYNGEYGVPRWLSEDSRLLLQDLLEVRPEHRMSVSELLDHPWVMKDSGQPVSWRNQLKRDDIDEDCVAQLSLHSGQPQTELKQKIAEWNYDYLTASYLLLLRKKMQNRPLTLNTSLKGRPIGFIPRRYANIAPRRLFANREEEADVASSSHGDAELAETQDELVTTPLPTSSAKLAEKSDSPCIGMITSSTAGEGSSTE